MTNLMIGLLGAALATNQPVALSNLVVQTTGMSITVPGTNDPVEVELQKLMDADDDAQAEVDGWIKENQQFAAKGAAIPNAELNQRILKRFEPVRTGYEDFIKRHPKYAAARVAYASFLNDLGDEEGAHDQLEVARELDPKDPAMWNNLANYYGEHGEVTNAFAYYAKAMELNPGESVYYQNLATAVYLFRRDATNFYRITEPEVFDKALALYGQALKLDPTNFPLATDLAQSYYGIRPMRTNDALQAWTNALSIAHDEIEREGVYTHLARVKTYIGRYAEARAHLNVVTNEMYLDLKTRLLKNLDRWENQAKQTNTPPLLNQQQISTNGPDTNTTQLPVKP